MAKKRHNFPRDDAFEGQDKINIEFREMQIFSLPLHENQRPKRLISKMKRFCGEWMKVLSGLN